MRLLLTLALSLLTTAAFAIDTLEYRLRLAEQAISFREPRTIVENANHSMRNDPVYRHIVANMNYDLIRNRAVNSMAGMFTAPELESIVEFISTPEGRSALQKMRQYDQLIAALIQQEMQDTLDRSTLDGTLPTTGGTNTRPRGGPFR